jgi:hypothetical protein
MSTWSDLKIELIGTGEQAGTWGTTTNTNLGTAIEEAIVGIAVADFPSDADYSLPWTDTNATQVARNFVLDVTSVFGSLTTTRNLIVPTIEKPYIVQNNTTGGQDIVVKTASGTGITVPNGRSAFVYTDGVNVVNAFDYVEEYSTAGLVFLVDGGGVVLISGVKGYLQVPFDCTITGWSLLADTIGSCVIDIWKDTYANYPPTGADSITASAKPTISSADKATSTTLTGWTTSISAGDVLAFNVDSATNITKLTITLNVSR